MLVLSIFVTSAVGLFTLSAVFLLLGEHVNFEDWQSLIGGILSAFAISGVALFSWTSERRRTELARRRVGYALLSEVQNWHERLDETQDQANRALDNRSTIDELSPTPFVPPFAILNSIGDGIGYIRPDTMSVLVRFYESWREYDQARQRVVALKSRGRESDALYHTSLSRLRDLIAITAYCSDLAHETERALLRDIFRQPQIAGHDLPRRPSPEPTSQRGLIAQHYRDRRAEAED